MSSLFAQCSKCGTFLPSLAGGIGIVLSDHGITRTCSPCRELENRPEVHVEHRKLARCPTCKAAHTAEELHIIPAALSDHKLEVECPSCETTFDVGVRLIPTYISPPVTS